MRKNNCIYLLILILLTGACSGIKKSSQHVKQNESLDFYYAFTEATKQALFNNFNQAISLYNKCIKVNPASSASYFQLSNIYMRIGNIGMAKELAKRALTLDDSNKWYYYHLASLYQYKNEVDSAINIYKKVLVIDKNNIESHFNLVLLYAENKDFDKAVKKLRNLKKEIGVNERIILIEHDVYSRNGKSKKAIKSLEDGIKLFPDNFELKGLMAEYYAEIKNVKKAQQYYDLMNEIDPENNRGQLSYAEFLLENNRKTEAYKIIEKIMRQDYLPVDTKIDIVVSLYSDKEIFELFKDEIVKLIDILKSKEKDNVKIYYLSADVNSRVGNFNVVSEDLKYVYSIEKQNPKVIEQIIQIENYLGNFDSVLYYADMALKTFDEAIFYLLKGTALMQINEYNNAVEVLHEAVSISKSKEEKLQVYNLLGECYRNTLNFTESDKYFEEALKIDEKNILIRNNYSYYLALRNVNLIKAEELSRFTIQAEPENSTYLDTYAWILYKMGKNDKAKKYIEEAIRYGGDSNSEILDHYGMILLMDEKYEEALNAFEKALVLDKNNAEIIEKIKKTKSLIKPKK